MQRTYQLSSIGPTRVHAGIAQLLANAGRRQRFAHGATIQQQGDEGDGFWLIETGKVMVCRFGSDGNVTVFAMLDPGDLFGELACFAGVSRQVDAVADGETTLVWISKAQADRLLESEPQFARWLLHSLAEQLRSALNRIEGDRRLSAEDRMARLLANRARRDGPRIAATQQHLADLLGVSRVTAGQSLSRLADAGLIALGYRHLQVIDLAGLRARAD